MFQQQMVYNTFNSCALIRLIAHREQESHPRYPIPNLHTEP